MRSIDLKKILPAPRQLGKPITSVPAGSHLILAAGFEDRTLGFLEGICFTKSGHKRVFKGASLINYLPYDPRNAKNRQKILKMLAQLGVKPREHDFDTAHPADFLGTAEDIVRQLDQAGHIYLDISVMSKLLILYMLNALWVKNFPFSVIYSEAKKYRPSRGEYKNSLRKGHFGQDILMEFLFSGVFEPIIPQPFVGRAPLGRPRALVTFLGFNKRQSIGAAAMIPYQWFIPIVGVPPNPKWRWREEALIKINNYGLLTSGQRMADIPMLKIDEEGKGRASKGEYRLHLSTFDYIATVKALLWISDVHRYTHFITIAPFGSKLQGLGTFIFTRIRPETQIVYASPKDFHPRYTEGVRAVYEIPFPTPKATEAKLIFEINPNLTYLERLSRGDAHALA